VSNPTVFSIKPWPIQFVQTHRQHLLQILLTLSISSALSIPTLPGVSKPALFHQRTPLMNFLAWLGQSGIQPMFVKQSLLSIFLDEPTAAQIYAADFSHYWHGCHCPNV
jgi:hypothetical protein